MTKARTSLSISVRRHFVDQFFFSHQELFVPSKLILDIGGKKDNKRGLFDLSKYGAKVKYVNIDQSSNPDIVSDAASIPLPDNSADIIIMGEILEHVPEPVLVLKEAYRLLKPGGLVLATVPFMYPVHADPFDFGRYTDYFWQKTSKQIGFAEIKTEKHGGMFAVAALMVQHLFRAKNISWQPIQSSLVKFLMWLDGKTVSPLLKAWATGYGLVFVK